MIARQLAPSLVPSLASAPTEPSRMLLLLLLSGFFVFMLLMVFLLFGTPFVLALPGVDLFAMLRLTLAQAAAGGLSLFWYARRNLRYLLPVYRALQLGPPTTDVPPPPFGSVRAAFRLPEHTTTATSTYLLVPLLRARRIGSPACQLSRISVDADHGRRRAGTMPTIVLFRQVIGAARALHPRRKPADRRNSVRLDFT